MALACVTPKCLLATVAVLWMTPFSTADSQGALSSPLPNAMFNCTPDLYVQLPYQVYYANPGDQLCVVCNSTAISIQTGIEAFVSFVIAGSNEPFCNNVPGCVTDPVQDELCFNEGIPEGSFGSYLCRHAIDLNSRCEVPFNITKAIPPSYNYGTPSSSNATLMEKDQGLMLIPTISNVGLPPAEYVWEYSLDNTDFAPLSNQSSYTKDPVEASGRGYYRFSAVNIANQANPFLLNYTVTVPFPPIITFSTEPQAPNPMITTEVVVTCQVVSYPKVNTGSLVITSDEIDVSSTILVSNTLEEDRAFHAMATTTVSGCPYRKYTCKATNSAGQVQKSLDICTAPPVITSLMVDLSGSTNTTARLVWTLPNQAQDITSYSIKYRMEDGMYSTTTHNNVNEHFYTVTGLQPGTYYEFRIQATNSVGASDFTDPVNFTTYSQPLVEPHGVRVTRFLADGGEIIILKWQPVVSTKLYTVTGYEVEYYSSAAVDDKYPRSTESLNITLSTTEVMMRQEYFFRVRAVGLYGAGPYSAQVEVGVLDSSTNAYFNISITTLQVKDDQAYMAWSTSGQENPTGIFVNISQLDSDSRVLFAIENITLDPEDTQACFNNLNNTDRYQYQFCVTASLADGTYPYTCRFPTTTSDLPATDFDCVSVSDSVVGSAIPEWAIGTIVAVSVLLVVLVFGGCGLCVAVRNRSARVEFKEDEPYSAFGLDKDNIPGVVNGGYSSRSVSPPRSCMQSYRHNHHQHQMEWQVSNPLDMVTPTATAV